VKARWAIVVIGAFVILQAAKLATQRRVASQTPAFPDAPPPADPLPIVRFESIVQTEPVPALMAAIALPAPPLDAQTPRHIAETAAGVLLGVLAGAFNALSSSAFVVAAVNAGSDRFPWDRPFLLVPTIVGLALAAPLYPPAGRRWWSGSGGFLKGLVAGGLLSYLGISVVCAVLVYRT
jgi:hypothetical protein